MRKEVVEWVDDLDGTSIQDGGKTVTFALEGKTYEIDLSPANLEKLRNALAPFVKAARGEGGARKAPTRSKSKTNDVQAVRAWAAANGYEVGDRGRIPAAVRDAYTAATR